MVMEKTAADGDVSLDKAAFIAFGKTTNGADDTIENFIASLYFEVAKLILANFEDVSTDGGGEQQGDAGERDVIRMTVDTTVRWRPIEICTISLSPYDLYFMTSVTSMTDSYRTLSLHLIE